MKIEKLDKTGSCERYLISSHNQRLDNIIINISDTLLSLLEHKIGKKIKIINLLNILANDFAINCDKNNKELNFSSEDYKRIIALAEKCNFQEVFY